MKISYSSSSSLRTFLVLLLCAAAFHVITAEDCTPGNENACEDSQEDSYCASNGICTIIGGCDVVDDCSNLANTPFPVNFCTGTMECQEGMCAMNCGAGPDFQPNQGSNNDCNDDSDCEGIGGVTTYCASDGSCTRIGSCDVVDDCSNLANSPFPVAACMGSMECQQGRCGMNCSGSDALSGCMSSADCPDEDEYCSSDGMCIENGMCILVDDCNSMDNIFAMVMCVGSMECEDGECAMNCDGSTDAPAPRCMSTNDCLGEEEYCTSDGVCLETAMCNVVDDCDNVDNIFPMIECFGTKDCVQGQCAMICGDILANGGEAVQGSDGSVSMSNPAVNVNANCTNTTDCDVGDEEEEYCASDGVCLENGMCNVVEDCHNMENLYAVTLCMGTIECLEGRCFMNCDVAPVEPIVDPAPENYCTSDADCNISTSTTRSVELDRGDRYCAQGICMDMGSCLSDMDCMNPVNMFDDKRCTGYLTCDDSGMCDRICGEMCKNGSQSVKCVADPCAPTLFNASELCPVSVSCRSSYCDGACNAMYFDAAGEVLNADCEYVDVDEAADENGNGSSINMNKNGNTAGDGTTMSKTGSTTTDGDDGETEPMASSMDSGATLFQTMTLSVSAILAASLFLSIY